MSPEPRGGFILYLHGFTSGPQSRKALALGARLAARGLAERFVCPQLPAAPAEAIALAESLLRAKVSPGGGMSVPPNKGNVSPGGGLAVPPDEPKVSPGGTAFNEITVVGSSLGGYYATHLAETHGCRAVLVNPAVVAHISLEKYLGPQTWLYTGEGFEFTPAHIDQLRAIHHPRLADPSRYWLLVEEGDETLDYRHAVAHYAGARQTVLPGGDHSFTRWTDYLDEIIAHAGLA